MSKRIATNGAEVLMVLGKYMGDPKAKLRAAVRFKCEPIIIKNIKEVFPFLSTKESRSYNIFFALTRKDGVMEFLLYWTTSHVQK